METWIKNLIGLLIVIILLGLARQVWFNGVDTEFSIKEATIKTSESPRPTPALGAVSKPAATPKPPALPECRLPEHGIESWAKTQIWIADSGWRKSGSSPAEFCGVQKLAREAQYPDRTIKLTDIPPEQHKTVRHPFRHDFYRYTCVLEDRWEPVYKLAPNEKCKQ
jgi:hypothetical protein